MFNTAAAPPSMPILQTNTSLTAPIPPTDKKLQTYRTGAINTKMIDVLEIVD